MPIGAFQEEFQRLRDHLNDLESKWQAALKELALATVKSEEDVLPEIAQFFLRVAGVKDPKNIIRTFEDGTVVQPYPLQNGIPDHEAISMLGHKDVTGIQYMPYNNGKPCWNAQDALVARRENEEMAAANPDVPPYKAVVPLRLERVRRYRGDFRYPPSEANGWPLWLLRELDRDHVMGLGYEVTW